MTIFILRKAVYEHAWILVASRMVATILCVSVVSAFAFDASDPSRRQSFGQILSTLLSLQQQQYQQYSRQRSEQTEKTPSARLTQYAQMLRESFPTAMSYDSLARRVTNIFPPTPMGRLSGSKSPSILLATSLCCDEVNRGLEHVFESHYEDAFHLGGLAGFPFSGVTGFNAMQSHIPDNGLALIIYGPHIGIDADGVLGKIDRHGQRNETACCGSAVTAANTIMKQPSVRHVGRGNIHPSTFKLLDVEQSQVNLLLAPFKDRLQRSENPMRELPNIIFQLQDQMLLQVMQEAGLKTPTVLLGGIQINTPVGEPDYFSPLRFDVLDKDGRLNDSLLDRLMQSL